METLGRLRRSRRALFETTPKRKSANKYSEYLWLRIFLYFCSLALYQLPDLQNYQKYTFSSRSKGCEPRFLKGTWPMMWWSWYAWHKKHVAFGSFEEQSNWTMCITNFWTFCEYSFDFMWLQYRVWDAVGSTIFSVSYIIILLSLYYIISYYFIIIFI